MVNVLRTTAVALLATTQLLAGCAERDRLEQITARGELVVVTRNSPTTYYQSNRGPSGFEYDLAAGIADQLGVGLRVELAYSLDELFTRLARGEADIAAAGLTLTGEREDRFAHTRAYASLKPQVVYKSGNRRPRRPADLAAMRLVVLAGSSHARSLAALKQSGYPDLAWEEIDGIDSMALLGLVDEGYADAAILSSIEFAAQQSLYPRLKVGFDLGSQQDVVWYLAGNGSADSLKQVIDEYFAGIDDSGELARLEELHFGHSDNVSRIGSHTFSVNMRNTLPEYEDMIRAVAEEYQMDWHLLAAMAYEESHWDPSAESPTGVQGMMMLTAPTARELGVSDRTDPWQSLRGGARYFKNIKRRLPDDIGEPDRTYFALAAYNIGRGHLEDARVLTERHGGDPHLWQEVMEYLPLLQKSPHFQTTRYGYARGLEAVTYVQNIRHYYNILHWQELPEQQQGPPMALEAYLPGPLRTLNLQAL